MFMASAAKFKFQISLDRDFGGLWVPVAQARMSAIAFDRAAFRAARL